jgi:hypothetical protein
VRAHPPLAAQPAYSRHAATSIARRSPMLVFRASRRTSAWKAMTTMWPYRCYLLAISPCRSRRT